MLKQFLKDSFIYTIGNILVRGVSYFLLPLYTRVLTPTDYGITDILLVFTSFVSITVALEIIQGLAIYYANSKTVQDKTSYASTALWFAMGAYSIFAIICLIFADSFSQLLLGETGKSLLFSLAVISTWGYGISYVATNQLRWEGKPQQYALVGLLTTLVTILLTILFVLVFSLGVFGVVAGQMIGNLAGSFLAVYFGKNFYAFQFDISRLKQMLAFSIPLVPSSLGSLIMVYINRVAINSIMTLADVGIYGVAFRITSLIEFIMMGFRTALSPLIYNNHENPETPREIARIFRYFISFSLLIALFLGLFSHEIVVFLAQPAYYEAASIIPIMAPAYVLGQMNIFTLGWAIAKKPKGFAIINILGALIAIALNFVLIPHIGIRGAAWANLVTYFLTFVSAMALSQHFYQVPHKWKNIIIAVFLFLSLFVLGEMLIPQGNMFLAVVLKSALVFVGSLFLVPVGLVDLKDLRLLAKKIKAFLELKIPSK